MVAATFSKTMMDKLQMSSLLLPSPALGEGFHEVLRATGHRFSRDGARLLASGDAVPVMASLNLTEAILEALPMGATNALCIDDITGRLDTRRRGASSLPTMAASAGRTNGEVVGARCSIGEAMA